MNTQSVASTGTPEPPPVREVPPASVLRWLRLGWEDLGRAGFPSLLHGAIVTAISLAIIAMTLLRWELVMIAVSCFLIVGPVLATGLYAISKTLDEGEQPDIEDAVDAWRHSSKCLFRFALLLVLVALLWVAISLTFFYFFVNVRIADPMDFLRYVLTQHDGLFLLWSILGGLVAAVVFGITVISIPLLVDRDVNTWLAIRTSVRAVGQNPVTMVWWSMVILFATGLSLVTLMVGFIVLYPVMGHASWHVYRDVVDAGALPSYRGSE